MRSRVFFLCLFDITNIRLQRVRVLPASQSESEFRVHVGLLKYALLKYAHHLVMRIVCGYLWL